MKDISSITGAEYAERLLAVNSPTRLIDHLIEKLAAKTGTGWESTLLEFKGCYHKRPGSDDPAPQDCFEWNVMHAFIALANAQGGCVVIGIAETDDHQLVPGDWDPDGILGCRDADGDGKPIPGREEKDLVDHVNSIFFKDKFKHNGRTYKFATQNKRNPSAPPAAHEFTHTSSRLTPKLSANSLPDNPNFLITGVIRLASEQRLTREVHYSWQNRLHPYIIGVKSISVTQKS